VVKVSGDNVPSVTKTVKNIYKA